MLDFPNAPTMNQIFTSGGLSWQWDGTKWIVTDAGTNPVPLPISLGGTGSTTLPLETIAGINNPKAMLWTNGTTIVSAASTSGSIGSAGTDYAFSIIGVGDSNSIHGQIGVSRARGTDVAPTALLSGDALGGLYYNGYNSGDGWGSSVAAGMIVSATENWSSATTRGTKVVWHNTQKVTGTAVPTMVLNDHGGLGILGPQSGTYEWGAAVELKRPFTAALPNVTQQLGQVYCCATLTNDVNPNPLTGGGAFSVIASEQWTAGTHGSNIEFWMTNFGSLTAIYAGGFINGLNFQIVGPTAYKAGGGTWTATSDIRLKTEVADYKRGLDTILALNPIQFKYNGKGGIEDTETVFYGLDADATFPILPEIVGKRMVKLERSTEPRELSPDGVEILQSEAPDTEVLTIDASALTYVLINAVKELEARLKAAEAKLEETA